MLLVGALAVTLTVAITAYAAQRGRSPLLWGGASLLISGSATLIALTAIGHMGTTDLVFAWRGGALAMLAAAAGPIVALLGNGLLASRLATLPMVQVKAKSSWMMWRLSDNDDEGYACRLSLDAHTIRGTRGGEESFSIPFSQLTALKVDGETLILRAADGRELRLILANGDPEHRSARIAEIEGIERAIAARRSATPN
ncbi:MAG: hypothetical protein R6X02_29615 [Enhygromyxa sp.]